MNMPNIYTFFYQDPQYLSPFKSKGVVLLNRAPRLRKKKSIAIFQKILSHFLKNFILFFKKHIFIKSTNISIIRYIYVIYKFINYLLFYKYFNKNIYYMNSLYNYINGKYMKKFVEGKINYYNYGILHTAFLKKFKIDFFYRKIRGVKSKRRYVKKVKIISFYRKRNKPKFWL